MSKAERRFIEYIESHIHLFFAAAVLVIGCGMRLAGYHFVSHDAGAYLLKWYDQIVERGISEQIGNYNIPYQILICILTKLPLAPLHAYKTVSCAFDLGMALLSGWIVWLLAENRREEKGVLAFTLVFCSPVVILNSAVWAQCDSIYTFFGIAALFALYREKYPAAFILLGLSFAFKLQAVFFLPFFLICYVCRKKFSILYFALVPAMMVLLSVPGLIAGRSVLDIFGIYSEQTKIYSRVYANFPNVYTLAADAGGSGEYTMFRWYAIMLTILVLGTGLYLCVQKGARLWNAQVFWAVVLWSLYSCTFFLPNMHERYAYALEVLSILYCFITPAGIPFAIVINVLPVFSYCDYLFGYRALSLPVSSLISLAVYACLTFWTFIGSARRSHDETSRKCCSEMERQNAERSTP